MDVVGIVKKTMLKISNLHVSVEGKSILKGVDLVVKPGEVHAIMGPNGSGKSTLAYVLAGHPRYEVASSKLTLDGKDLLEMTPDQRAKAGLFLAFQYPVAVDGVSVEKFLRSASEAIMGKKTGALEFRKYLTEEAKKLGVKEELLKRSLNQGFSGGEKKRVEILQLLVLKPKYAILDETDSGLDVDALRSVAKGIMLNAQRKIGMIVITHYQRILKHIKPDFVHVMKDGKIVESGDKNLAEKVEKKGYK